MGRYMVILHMIPSKEGFCDLSTLTTTASKLSWERTRGLLVIYVMRPPEAEMEEMEVRIVQARQVLLAGPSSTDEQRRNLKKFISEGLPCAVERLQRLPMSTSTAKRAARAFTLAQEFIDTCLRSPLLEEGPMRIDLSPLLYCLRVLVSGLEPVPTRYCEPGQLTGSAGGVGGASAHPSYCFNRDHGRPLLRAFQGRVKHFWPDDEAALR